MRSRATGVLVVAGLLVAAAVGLVLSLTLTGGPDLSSPAATARSWVEAANADDLDGMRATFCPADREVPADAQQRIAETRAAYPDMTYRVAGVRPVDARTATVTVAYVDGPPPAGEQGTSSTLTVRLLDGEWLFCSG